MVHPGIVKEGLAIPVWHEAERGTLAEKPIADLGIAPFDEVYQAVKGKPPSGQLWEAFQTIRTISGTMIRILALPPGAPNRRPSRRLQAALVRMNADKAYAADAMKTIGFVPEYATGPNTSHEVRTALTVSPADARLHRGLCEEGEPVMRASLVTITYGIHRFTRAR